MFTKEINHGYDKGYSTKHMVDAQRPSSSKSEIRITVVVPSNSKFKD